MQQKKFNVKKVQPEKSAALGKCTLEIPKNEMSAMRKKCDMNKVQWQGEKVVQEECTGLHI